MTAHNSTSAKPALQVVDNRRAYIQMTDYELVVACQAHNKLAFEELIKRNHKAIYGMLHQIAPDWRDINDLAQEVLIRVWRSVPTLRNPHSFKTWLTHIITNLFYDELRKRPKQMTLSIDEPMTSDGSEDGVTRELPDTSRVPDEVVERHELSEAIDLAILQLPQQFRTTIVLREMQGLSYDEIATITHAERGTVKSRIARARAKIQHALQPYVGAA
ncbi:MAG TPA: sigma-70 family RNA polymerase sigma factor [Planktothrix sp.]|jgi:RNA polymerase sigma-70 factor (ECF subfamily)